MQKRTRDEYNHFDEILNINNYNPFEMARQIPNTTDGIEIVSTNGKARGVMRGKYAARIKSGAESIEIVLKKLDTFFRANGKISSSVKPEIEVYRNDIISMDAWLFLKTVTYSEYNTLKYLNNLQYLFCPKLYGFIKIDENHCFMVTEYVSIVLSSEFERNFPGKTFYIFRCIALQDLHSLNILHSDFHRNNIAFRQSGFPVIIDIDTKLNKFKGDYADLGELKDNYSEGFSKILDINKETSLEFMQDKNTNLDYRVASWCISSEFNKLDEKLRLIRKYQNDISKALYKQNDNEDYYLSSKNLDENLHALILKKNKLLKQVYINYYFYDQKLLSKARTNVLYMLEKSIKKIFQHVHHLKNPTGKGIEWSLQETELEMKKVLYFLIKKYQNEIEATIKKTSQAGKIGLPGNKFHIHNTINAVSLETLNNIMIELDTIKKNLGGKRLVGSMYRRKLENFFKSGIWKNIFQ